jgi:hypothetical protein
MSVSQESLQEFYDELESHDWFYFYSDDIKAFSAGQSNETKLNAKSNTNPASEYLIVSGLEGTSKVEIYTITGQLVQTENFENETRLKLDLNAGMYLVKVTNGVQSTTKKIIVK